MKRKWIIGITISTIILGTVVAIELPTNHQNVGTTNETTMVDSQPLSMLSPTKTPTKTQMKRVFDQIWDLFDLYYPNFKQKGVNWSDEKSKYEPTALKAKTWSQFFVVVNQMISDLRDGHCKLVGEPRPTVYTPLILTTYSNDHVVVAWSNLSSKIPVGSIVTGVDGNPVADRLNRLTYSDGDAYLAGQSALKTTVNKPEQITLWEPSTNQTVDVTVPVYPTKGPIPNNGLAKMNDAFERAWVFKPGETYGKPLSNASSSFRIAHLGNGILYAYIPAMLPPGGLSNEFKRLFVLAQGSKGLIIDIRDNYGGGMYPGLWFARHLYNKTVAPLEVRFPTSVYNSLPPNLTDGNQTIPLKPVPSQTTPTNFTKWGVMSISPLTPHLNIPVALLTNGMNYSAAENFTAFMRVAPNVATFGSTTGGWDGSPGVHPVMKGVTVEISSWQERVMSTGFPIEGFGLHPDYPVYISNKTLTNEIKYSLGGEVTQAMAHDPVLQSARDWILKKIK